jgi:bifunctional DNase/RNase
MIIKGLMLDPVSNSPIVVLKDAEDKVFLPIWVGIFEANAIALRLENIATPRPMTHDLLRNTIESLDAHITQIVISELKESTFYATVHLTSGEKTLVIDARPSDAIALALRSEAPIFVAQDVIDRAQTITIDETQEDRLKKWLEQATPEDLGKYKM